VPTRERDNFALSPSEIERCISECSKVLVLVTVNNPTGAVTPPETIREIADLARGFDLLVISDEIYEKLIFEGFKHLSVGSLAGMRERTITVNSFFQGICDDGLASRLPGCSSTLRAHAA
jgi:aminotransferase